MNNKKQLATEITEHTEKNRLVVEYWRFTQYEQRSKP
jgi:hypothetical protein